MQEQSPQRRIWPLPAQVAVEGLLIAAAVAVYATVAYLNFDQGQVRGPFAVPRYYQLGDFDKFPPVGGQFDLNKNLDNFDVSPLALPLGKNIPGGEKEITVPPRTADN